MDNMDVGVLLISAYAPVSNASDDIWSEYYEQLDRLSEGSGQMTF